MFVIDVYKTLKYTPFLLFCQNGVYAQNQTLPVGSTHSYSVDVNDFNNSISDINYIWNVLDNNFDGTLSQNHNKITINWGDSPAGIYHLKVIKTNTCGEIEQSITVKLVDSNKNIIQPNFFICPSNSSNVTLFLEKEYDTYEWYNNQDDYLGNKSTQIVQEPGLYKVKVVKNDIENIITTKVQLVEFPSMIVNTNTDNSLIVVTSGGNTNVLYQLKNLNDQIIKPWQPSNTFYDIPQGKYKIEVKSINGECITSLQSDIISFPNFLSPNDDGYNDYWDLSKVLINYPKAIVEIYDRYGKQLKIMTIKDNFKWDGRYNGKKLPSDSYWYRIKLDETQTKTGSVLLKNKSEY